MSRPSNFVWPLVLLSGSAASMAAPAAEVELHIPRAADDTAYVGGDDIAAEIREVHRLEWGRGRNRVAIDGLALGVEPSSLSVTAAQPDAPTVSNWSLDFDLADQTRWLQSLLGGRVMLRQGGTQVIGALLTAQSPVVLRDDAANLHAFASYDLLTALDPVVAQSPLPRVWLEVETDQVRTADYVLRYRSTALSWRAQAIATTTAGADCLIQLTVPLTLDNQSGRSFASARVELYDQTTTGQRRRWVYRAPTALNLPRAAPLQLDLVAAGAEAPCVRRNRLSFDGSIDSATGVESLTFVSPVLRAGVEELPPLSARWFERTGIEPATWRGTFPLGPTADGRLELQAPIDGLRGIKRVIAERGSSGQVGHEIAIELELSNDNDRALVLVVYDALDSRYNVPEASHEFSRSLDGIEITVEVAARSRVSLRYVARLAR